MTRMETSEEPDPAAVLAALSVCEALMVALVEKGLLEWSDVEDSLQAAIEAHVNAEPSNYSEEQHARAGRIVKFLMTRANSIRAAGHL